MLLAVDCAVRVTEEDVVGVDVTDAVSVDDADSELDSVGAAVVEAVNVDVAVELPLVVDDVVAVCVGVCVMMAAYAARSTASWTAPAPSTRAGGDQLPPPAASQDRARVRTPAFST